MEVEVEVAENEKSSATAEARKNDSEDEHADHTDQSSKPKSAALFLLRSSTMAQSLQLSI